MEKKLPSEEQARLVTALSYVEGAIELSQAAARLLLQSRTVREANTSGLPSELLDRCLVAAKARSERN